MTHDSRRYHRTRRPTFTRQYGMLGAVGTTIADAAGAAGTGIADAAGAVGTGLGNAAGAVGTGLANAAGAVGPGIESVAGKVLGTTGLENVAQGLQSLFSGGGGEAGYLQSLGQAVPQGVELAGPSSTFTGPGFMGGLVQGFTGAVNPVSNPSAGTSLGTGLGQMAQTVNKLSSVGPGIPELPQSPILQPAGAGLMRPKPVVPGGSAKPEQGNIMKMLGQILAAV